MYCPNCGIEIHTEGFFCAKCRKDIAYLTQKQAAPEPATDTEGTDTEGTATATPEDPAAENSPANKGFFCNYCGTFVYPDDNYCYQCGKKTRKEYYSESSAKKSKFFSFGKKA